MILLHEFARDIFTPRENLPVHEWAEKHVTISSGTQDPGPYSTALYPYVREPLECFRSPDVEDIVLVWGSQTSKTTTFAIGNLWAVENDPVNTIWAMDTAKNAEKFSKDRWSPMERDTPLVAARKGQKRGDNNVLEKRFDQMTLYFVGSNSPGTLASQPAGRVIADEIDKWPGAKKNEAAATKLIEERTKAFRGAKRFWASTPTIEEGSIWVRWENSDKRFFMLPCPCCGERFKLVVNGETEGLRWPQEAKDEEGNWDLERVNKETFYLTPCCGHHLSDGEKIRISREGEWVATAAGSPRTRGYHLNSLYSPKVSFGQAAVEFLKSKVNPGDLQNFTNSWEALPWKDRIIEVKPEQIKKVEADYHRGDRVGKVRVLMIDVQRKDLRINVRGYGPDSQLIEWGTMATWDDCDELQSKLNIEHVGVDVQFPDRQQEAFQEIFERRDKGWFAIEGKGAGQGLFGKLYAANRINPFVGERKKLVSARSKIMYLQINSEVWKAELARKRNAEGPEWKVYQDIEPGYVRELYAEFQRKVMKRGKTVTEWAVKSHRQNHQFDLEYYQLAVAHFLKLAPYDRGKSGSAFPPKEPEKPAKEGVEIASEEPIPEPQETSFFKPIASRG